VHSPEDVEKVLGLRATGLDATEIARVAGVPRGTVRDWLAGRVPRRMRAGEGGVISCCTSCGAPSHRFADLPSSYVYLLGLYLGDGCLSAHRRGVYKLRVILDLRYPRIVQDCEQAIREVNPGRRVHLVKRRSNFVDSADYSNVEVASYSKSWPCLFPQHGPGRKHRRSIDLAEWQRELVARHPRSLLRGLIHSDGCRFMNTGRKWRHPRYSFSNLSDDILRIFCRGCDLVGVNWTTAGHTIYVSRVADVATLDEFIGPKS
jgi:hypothetical protein